MLHSTISRHLCGNLHKNMTVVRFFTNITRSLPHSTFFNSICTSCAKRSNLPTVCSRTIDWKACNTPGQSSKSSYCSAPSDAFIVLDGDTDRFGGVRINVEQQLRGNSLFMSPEILKKALLGTISQCRTEGRTTIWLEIPAHCGQVIPLAADAGFIFHHAEGHLIMMYQWLGEGETKVPDYATHQIGVSGFVLDEESERVLMVQDKHRLARWKFPGGFSKLSEDFNETAVREVHEETGIDAEFCSILAFRQQHLMPHSFDRSDIYVVCRLKPVTFDLNICSEELVDAKWMDLEGLLTDEVHTHLTREVARLAKYGLRMGFESVDISMRELQSVYKGKTYKLFTRPCSTD